MKNLFRFLLSMPAFLIISTVYGQWVQDTNGNETLDHTSYSTTSVAIKNSPALTTNYGSASLKIGDYALAQTWSGNYCGSGLFSISNATNPTTSPVMAMYNGKIGFSYQNSLLCQSSLPAKYFFDTLTAMNRLYVGNLTTPNPTLNPKYKLYVGGSMICEELVVKLKANWADYVFAPNYKLKSLSEVKAFIAENSHLPDVPAACEVEEKGVATGEMLTIQMKKIEELTLYMIQMQEANEAMQKTNDALLKRIEALETK